MMNILKKIPIICFLFAITLNCNAQNNNSYKQALNYISNDDELVKMLRDHNLYYPTLLYSNSELVYKVYPEKPGMGGQYHRNIHLFIMLKNMVCILKI